MNAEKVNVFQYLDAALRRKWLILVPFAVCSSAAFYFGLTLPPIYESKTTILVEPQQVPEDYVHSTVTGSVQDRLSTISQQILSRTRLEGVILELNLFPEQRAKMPMEAVVQDMRENIDIKVESKTNESRTQGAAVAFSLGFFGKDPATVQKVTQKLAMLYIEENLRVREALARGTREFMEKQLADIEATLKGREEEIRKFRQAHMGELPEQLDANLRTLEQFQQQRASVLLSIHNAEERRLLLEQQLSATHRYVAGGTDDQEYLLRQLEEKRQALATLRSKYTDRYPDVVRLEKEIQDLNLRIASGQEAAKEHSASTSSPINPAYRRIDDQIEAVDLNLRGLREELRQLTEKMDLVEKSIENAPKLEQEMMTLTRDYETIQKSYNSMTERKINAEISENMELRQKSEQFHILDPANLPEKPARPNRPRILLLGLLLGACLGGGLAFAAEYMDPAIRSVEAVKAEFSIPILGVIPMLRTSEQVRSIEIRKRWLIWGSISSFVILVVCVQLFVTRIDRLVAGLLRPLL